MNRTVTGSFILTWFISVVCFVNFTNVNDVQHGWTLLGSWMMMGLISLLPATAVALIVSGLMENKGSCSGSAG